MKADFQKIKSVNDELTLFLFKEDALIYSSLTNKLHVLNAVGIYIWLQLEEGLSQQQVIDLCRENSSTNTQQNNSENQQTLTDLVTELVYLLKHAKINSHTQTAEQENEKENEKEDIWLNEIKLQTVSEANVKNLQAYRILDVDFYFSFPNTEVETIVTPMLKQFEIEVNELSNSSEFKKIHFKIMSDNAGAYRLKINEYLFSWEISSQRLLSFVLDRLRKIAFHFSERHSGVHAAVLCKGETAMLMPAKSYSGKSTLSAALVAKGYQYLSDEMAVLDENFNARPVPLGLGLKEGSWEIIKSYMPQIEHVTAMERWDGIPIKYLPVNYQCTKGTTLKGAALSRERKKITHLIIPNYQQGSPAKLTPLSVPQALYELFEAGYTQGKDQTEKSVEELIHQLSERPCYHLAFDNLEQAVQALDDLQ